jgi:hypothetical protein
LTFCFQLPQKQRLNEKIASARERIESKRRVLADLLVQKVAIANLISRNQQSGSSKGVSRPVVESPCHLGIMTPPGRPSHPSPRRSIASPYNHALSPFYPNHHTSAFSPFNVQHSQPILKFTGEQNVDVLELPFILMACPVKERMDCQIDESLSLVDFSSS